MTEKTYMLIVLNHLLGVIKTSLDLEDGACVSYGERLTFSEEFLHYGEAQIHLVSDENLNKFNLTNLDIEKALVYDLGKKKALKI